jgi:hypothetical protein
MPGAAQPYCTFLSKGPPSAGRLLQERGAVIAPQLLPPRFEDLKGLAAGISFSRFLFR